MSPSLVRHCAPPSYSCRIPVYHPATAGYCATCSFMLARGDFAQDVAEERYDTEWGHRGSLGLAKYDGLGQYETAKLALAMLNLKNLAQTWADRAVADEAWHEAETSPDVLGAEDEADAAADRAYDEARDWALVHS